jgi:uncharacterized membrane-anchored protein
MTKGTLFRIAVALQVALLGWMVAASERTLSRGTLVVLKVRPVDPIDYMTGRFVRVRPEIATLDLAVVPLVGEPGESSNGVLPGDSPYAGLLNDPVLVELRPAGGLWIATRVVWAGGAVAPHAPYLRGRVESVHENHLDVDYGLERFDIPYDAEDPSPLTRSGEHVVALAVRVADDGRSVTEDLVVDGRPFAEWNAAEKAKRK